MRTSRLVRDLCKPDTADQAARRRRQLAILAQVREEVAARFPNITTAAEAQAALDWARERELQLQKEGKAT